MLEAFVLNQVLVLPLLGAGLLLFGVGKLRAGQ